MNNKYSMNTPFTQVLRMTSWFVLFGALRSANTHWPYSLLSLALMVLYPLQPWAFGIKVCCYTVVTLLLHCCYTVVTLLLHCCCTVVALLLHCCCTVVALLLHCCCSVVTLLFHCCCTVVALALMVLHPLQPRAFGIQGKVSSKYCWILF
jgi:hypothetical protein